MKHIEQLNLWVEGQSIHNDELGECCPDFSCCRPELLAPKEVREIFRHAYLKGNEETTMRLLMEFLAKSLVGQNVYIAGLEASRQELES